MSLVRDWSSLTEEAVVATAHRLHSGCACKGWDLHAREAVAQVDRLGQAFLMTLGGRQAPIVLALPPEPPVGTTVEFVGGDRAGRRFRSQDGVWVDTTTRRWCSHWVDVLTMAGPEGVRVVEGGEPNAG